MARFRYKHIQSTVENKVPSDLLDGEIAVNRFVGKEKLFIKNASGNVVSFSSSSEIDGKLADKLDVNTFTTYSGAVDTSISSKASQSDLNALSGTVTGHTADTTIHLTSTEKGQLHTHSNKSALDAITGNVGTMAYEDKTSYSSATEVNTALGNKANTSDLDNFFDDAKYEDSGTTKVINFYHGDTIKSTIDASDFIVDGMVESVSAVTSGNTTVLDIKWNTAAGGQETIVDIGDLFEADNYYTKTNIDGLVGSGFTSSSITDVIIENEKIISAALTDLDERKLDATAYTPTDLSNYYTKSETSGATEISNALGGKVNSATFTGHTADTAMHFTTTEKTNLDSLATNIAAISGITSTKVSNWDGAATNSHTHSNKTYLDGITGTVGTMVYQNANSYSSATQVNTALAGKSDTGHTHVSSAVTAMTGYAKAASGSSIATGDTLNQAIGKLEAYVDDLNGQSETIAAALVGLNENKADKSTTLSGYGITNAYTKTEIDNMIGNIETLLAAI